jgi:hypothetical protein
VEQWGEDKGKEISLLEKTNSMEDLVGNEENGYPVPEPKK